ncbi:putative V-type proton ATPase subunit F [Hypsibius exemplaris]|uniref:V-type proton ATPase subunit F n=1 Tax=Hypsibius exemplaris TaxID=2072580 RepID=A0A1W0WHD5_HYPEX|nr:putative V-type proton ATPase subunit F [Hypsibius exemplaris]
MASENKEPRSQKTTTGGGDSYKVVETGANRGRLIAVIGDEDTCVGFILGGVGELNRAKQANYFIVAKDTPVAETEEAFKAFTRRDDIGIVLILQNIAETIRYAIDAYKQTIPTVLEVPSKDHPYDASKDSILRRARGMFNSEDFR